ncbi:MotA/TolQ/ExbB proton channel family protein [Bacillus massilinigeriensis]|uniref:hypothetical protein n=1 Tax=Bacillus massilionigeriensis TaxID=1805475 RepID=UPI00096B1AA8|nr:hypothetical protein [Bacillus massilionigeriensis]
MNKGLLESLGHNKIEGILATIHALVELSNKAYKYGILSMEDDIPNLSSNFFKHAIRLMVEGYYEEELRLMLDNDISATECSRMELLEKQLIKEGALLIIRGEYGNPLLDQLLSIIEKDLTLSHEIKKTEDVFKIWMLLKGNI